jgi:hypothetical protein
MHAFYKIHSPLQKSYTHSVTFDDDEVRFGIHYRQYVTLCGGLFDNDEDPEFSWRLIIRLALILYPVCRFGEELRVRAIRLSKKMREIKIRKIELAGLYGIALANEGELTKIYK